MTDKPWYQNPATFSARLQACNGNVARLSRESGTAQTVIKEWRAKHGVTLRNTDEPAVKVESADAALLQKIELLQLENSRLRKAANAAATGDLEAERLTRRIEARIDGIRPEWSPWPIVGSGNPGTRTAQDLVLPYSDLHAAEVVSLEETRGINEYDWSIMVDRMGQIQETVISHVEHFGFDIATFHIPMLGDMLSGNIHAELAMTNDRPLAEATVDLAEAHIPWLLGFAEYFNGSKISVSGVPGNHPRAWVKPQAKMAHDNADWVFYKILEAALKGHPQFEFSFPRGSMNELMFAGRWRALALHGDGIRSTMPGVPWGGVIRRVTTLEAQFQLARKPLDYILMGHFHQENQLSGVATKTWVNGSVKGADEYSLKAYGQGRPAEQILLTFHPKRGYTGQYAVQLQDGRPASEGWA